MDSSKIVLWTQRTYDTRVPYLLTLCVGPQHADALSAYPQARAVMDDFGNLVIVRGWL
jgi:hypothetical protein